MTSQTLELVLTLKLEKKILYTDISLLSHKSCSGSARRVAES